MSIKSREALLDEIYFEHRGLPEGSSQGGQVCPSCEGGASKERSFSITRRGDLLLFNCHRASCTFYGVIRLVGGERAQVASYKTDSSKAHKPVVKTYELSEATAKLLATKFSIPTESLRFAGLRWTGDGDHYLERRVCLPIYGPNSEERGQVLRSYVEGVEPKAINRLYSPDAVAASWYKFKRKSDVLVLVEDQMSAIKLAPYIHSLALLGVHLSESKAQEIIDGGYKQVFISLDNDATHEAIKMQLRFRNTIKGLLVASLHKDIKNMNTEEFNTYVSSTLQ